MKTSRSTKKIAPAVYVLAACDITEDGFKKRGVQYLHSPEGAPGRVLAVESEFCIVFWERGTISTVHRDDLVSVADLDALVKQAERAGGYLDLNA